MDRVQAKACAEGSAAACLAAARGYAPSPGWRVRLSAGEAKRREQGVFAYARRACELGDGAGCNLAAAWAGYAVDYAMSIEMLSRGCELGHVGSCGALAVGEFEQAQDADACRRQAETVRQACIADAISVGGGRNIEYHGGFCRFLYLAYRGEGDKGCHLRNRSTAATMLRLQCSQGIKEDCPCIKEEDCRDPRFPYPLDLLPSYIGCVPKGASERPRRCEVSVDN